MKKCFIVLALIGLFSWSACESLNYTTNSNANRFASSGGDKHLSVQEIRDKAAACYDLDLGSHQQLVFNYDTDYYGTSTIATPINFLSEQFMKMEQKKGEHREDKDATSEALDKVLSEFKTYYEQEVVANGGTPGTETYRTINDPYTSGLEQYWAIMVAQCITTQLIKYGEQQSWSIGGMVEDGVAYCYGFAYMFEYVLDKISDNITVDQYYDIADSHTYVEVKFRPQRTSVIVNGVYTRNDTRVEQEWCYYVESGSDSLISDTVLYPCD